MLHEQARKSPIYGNCKVLDPAGTLIFRCDQKKADWYIKKGLGELVAEEPYYTVQLNFTPKGNGHVGEPFYLQDKQNRCVMCGSDIDLTKHHCVPYCYRKFFPEEFKMHTSHDILALCIPHHHEYEKHATRLKIELGRLYGVPLSGQGVYYDRAVARVRGAAHTLLQHKSVIPPDRAEELLQRVREYLEKKPGEPVTDDELQALKLLHPSIKTEEYEKHGEGIVKQLKYIGAFCEMWRYHFIDCMRPQFLPAHWSVSYIPKVRKRGTHDEEREAQKSG